MRKKIVGPRQLQRIIVRQCLTYEAASIDIARLIPPRAGGKKAGLSVGYLSKVANGQTPSLKLGLVIVRWARAHREELTLADLGISSSGW
jgi:hypothetical protein